MPSSLVESRYGDLELLLDDERGVDLDATAPPEEVLKHAPETLVEMRA